MYDDKHVRDDPLRWVGVGVHVLNIHYTFNKRKCRHVLPVNMLDHSNEKNYSI
jgi:hypothetical protein